MTDRLETIFALSSGLGRAGVSVIRVSGPRVRFVLETISRIVPAARHARLRSLKREDGSRIDSGLILFFESPHSFTGEDCAEFQIHGGRAVVRAMLERLAGIPGCRLAQAGEFTRRALENGKIDLLGAEALADLIDAETEAQRRQAISGQSGRLQREVTALREAVLGAMALVEAEIDFSDEGDVQELVAGQVQAALQSVTERIAVLLSGAAASERVRRGLRVVLSGPVNVGKSTLLNTLAGRDVAIVSSQPGTTRDQIEVHLDLNGWPVTIVDTAGRRETVDEVEIEGIRRAQIAVLEADVVLELISGETPILTETITGTNAVYLRVLTKIDSYPDHKFDGIRISAVTGAGIDHLLSCLSAEAERSMRVGDSAVVANLRQRLALEAAREAIRTASLTGIAAELQAEELRSAVTHLGLMIGAIGSEDVLGEVFGRFCIGK